MSNLIWLGPLCSFGASLLWALGSNIFARLSMVYPAFVVNVTRAMVGFPIFLGVLLYEKGWSAFDPLTWKSVGWLGLSMTASYALGDFSFFVSAQSIGVPSSLAIASSYPIWSALVGWIFKGQSLSLFQSLGLVLVVSGVVTVILSARNSSRRPEDAVSIKKGILLAMATSLFWSLNTVAVTQGSEGLDVALVATVRLFLALFLCPAFGYLIVQKRVVPWMKWTDLKRDLWIFVLEGFGGTFCFIYGFAHSPLAIAAALSSLAPVLSVPLSLLSGQKRPSWMQMAGIALVFLGAWQLVAGVGS